VIGGLSFWISHVLVSDIPTKDSIHAAVQKIGTHSLSVAGTKGQPTLVGYVVFFACLMGLRRWWRQADSFRSGRLAIWSIIPTAVVALALTAIIAFPTVWGTVWAAAISATIQLSASWVAPRDRAALLETANHG
jgi:eukaryotic-like serine/threonine-protein kinase